MNLRRSIVSEELLNFIPCDCRVRTVVDRLRTNGIVTSVGC
jgi:hypothetical protein